MVGLRLALLTISMAVGLTVAGSRKDLVRPTLDELLRNLPLRLVIGGYTVLMVVPILPVFALPAAGAVREDYFVAGACWLASGALSLWARRSVPGPDDVFGLFTRRTALLMCGLVLGGTGVLAIVLSAIRF